MLKIDLERGPTSGGDLKAIAAMLERPVIEKILAQLVLDLQPPPKAPAREAGGIKLAEPHPRRRKHTRR